ncbi:Molybdopterin-binding domain of aldehyde dehydrogenase-domain-containing protein [Aspergillus pseudoustus]|uniref:Molybdopterin-binding domain of aldehyde dehydrogenase-domain-containing protein n=1 Tax=Aspergillus pseudoustus TaxID=1810923 RepID=A0ABR4J5K6_9EURO
MEALLSCGSSTLSFYVNGTAINVSNPHPRWTLLDFIRSQDGLKGTKLGCGEGGCGACTVVLQTRDRNKRLRHLAVNACLYPLIGVAGKHVITIEGLGTIDAPHPLQERIAKLHASQCGFCTPGIVMSLYAVIRNAFDADTGTFKLSADDIESKGHLDGNLCRCTGYKPIFQAAKTFITEDLRAGISIEPSQLAGSSEAVEHDYTDSASSASRPGTSGSCGRPGGCCKDSPGSLCGSFSDSTDITTPSSSLEKQFDFIPYVPHTELIYPPRLFKFEPKLLCYGNETQAWVKPTTIAETLDILSRFPAATLVTGASEVQVDVRFKDLSIPISVFIGDIPELTSITWSEDGQTLNVGGTASLSDLEAECLKYIPQYTSSNPGYASVLSTITKTLRYFAGRQIRNAASLAGNIATASPISDMNPVLLALDAKVHTLSSQGEDIIIPMISMFKGYRKTALQPASLITKISIPMPSSDTFDIIESYKQAKRKDDDIAIVTAAFRLRLSPPFSSGEDPTISSITLAFGGMAPTTVLAGKTSAALTNKPWNEPTLSLALDSLLTEFPLPYSVPGGMASYRRTLTLSLFTRFYHHINTILKHAHPAAALSTMPDPTSHTLGPSPDKSASTEIHRHLSSGTRDSDNPTAQRVVGQALPHLSGLKHATGEAEYLDDTAPLHRELHGALVLSQRAHAKLVSIDWTPAVGPGLALGYVDHASLPAERNHWGPVVHDEPIFACGEVLAHGQIIGMVYAESALVAQEAAKRVVVGYEELPAILTIDEAIAAESFFPHGKELRKGADPKDIPGIIDQCEFSLSGTSRIGGQEHFYLETNAALAVPGTEDGNIEVWSSTQNTIETQDFVSSALGIPRHKINARVRRMGGAFGGKESRSVPIATIAALVAQKTKRPLRIMLNRDEDMMTSGQRHPMQCRWRVGFNSSGKLMALSADVYNNAGYSSDMSNAVMDRCLTHLENCYYVPNAHFRGWVCRTNTHSNTAFRGFGGPQAMYFAESIIYAVAEELGMDVDEVRRRNLYEIGQLTPFHQVIDEDWHVPILLEQVRQEATYDERRREIEHFNARHRYRKRGICLVPTKFGISFATALHLNQAGASVKMYTDGSVLLNHGGTEMGQGLYTKMVQVAAQELGISVDQVYTEDTSSYQTANASPTAASSGSDLNGMAIKHACDQLNERLKPYREKFGPDADMATIAKAAYRDRVNLAASGFYKMPTIGHVWGNYDPETQKPMYFYFTQGVACTEVELDLLTGDHTVLRTDIKMDVGRSINPAIDYGQIEGAFVQGQGLFTMEESLWTRSGQLATRGPGAYKIPGFCDIPQEFNVSFLKGVGWKTLRSIQSSKGIGEPPLFLGSTVLFALRDALNAARRDNGVAERLVLDSPATAERLRLGVRDELVERARVEPKDGERGFFVTVA